MPLPNIRNKYTVREDGHLPLLEQEVRSIVKARKLGVHTPVVYYVEFGANVIYMEKIVGHSLKELLLAGKLSDEGTVLPVSLLPLSPSSTFFCKVLLILLWLADGTLPSPLFFELRFT